MCKTVMINEAKALSKRDLKHMNDRHDLIIIEMRINDEKVRALLDTGANTSYISYNCVLNMKMENMIDKRNKIKYKNTSCNMISYGTLWHVKMNISDIECSCKFSVIDMNAEVDMVLGLNFIKQYGVIIDYNNRELYFENFMLRF